MKYGYLIGGIGCAALSLTIGVSFQSALARASLPDVATNAVLNARIEISNPITLEAFLATRSGEELQGAILQSSFTIGEEEIQEFYVVDVEGKNKDIQVDYAINRKILLENSKAIRELSVSDGEELEHISIHAFSVRGKKDDIDALQKGLDVRGVEFREVRPSLPQEEKKSLKPQEAPIEEEGGFSVSALPVSQPLYQRVPTSGTSYFYPDSAGGRSVEQHMRWNNTNFLSDQTYEHKVYLDNWDRKTYLDATSTEYPNCYPAAVYAATSWPAASRPYLDTRLNRNLISCEIDELSYTIGAAQADALNANTTYWTYMRLANGNASTDRFKLQGQVGFRYPSNCYTTWCSEKYAVETVSPRWTSIYTLIPSWSTAVPGVQSWTFSGVPPISPGNVSTSNLTTSSLRVNFTDNSFDEAQTLLYQWSASTGWVQFRKFSVLSDAGKKWYTNILGLAPKTTYCYVLIAGNPVGWSAYSNQVCASTK